MIKSKEQVKREIKARNIKANREFRRKMRVLFRDLNMFSDRSWAADINEIN